MDNISNNDILFIPPNPNSQESFMKPTTCLRWVKEGNEKVLMQLWVCVTDSRKEWRKVPEE